MELMSNQVFRLLLDDSSDAYPAGIYRVIFDEASINKTVCVCIQTAEDAPTRPGGRRKLKTTKHPRKKAPAALIGELIWMDRDCLQRLATNKLLIMVEIDREPIYFVPIESPKEQAIFTQRCKSMAGFLDAQKMQESILVHEGLGGLVREAMATGKVCRAYVYKQWSTLCRLGLSEISLLPRRDRCGAPNVKRPCDPGGRKKPGRKTHTQRIAKAHGIDLPPKQPGMSTEWRASIIAGDNQIKTPVKPAMAKRCNLILESSFVKKYRQENGVLVPVELKLGEYPNKQQIRRVLEVEVPRCRCRFNTDHLCRLNIDQGLKLAA